MASQPSSPIYLPFPIPEPEDPLFGTDGLFDSILKTDFGPGPSFLDYFLSPEGQVVFSDLMGEKPIDEMYAPRENAIGFDMPTALSEPSSLGSGSVFTPGFHQSAAEVWL